MWMSPPDDDQDGYGDDDDDQDDDNDDGDDQDDDQDDGDDQDVSTVLRCKGMGDGATNSIKRVAIPVLQPSDSF